MKLDVHTMKTHRRERDGADDIYHEGSGRWIPKWRLNVSVPPHKIEKHSKLMKFVALRAWFKTYTNHYRQIWKRGITNTFTCDDNSAITYPSGCARRLIAADGNGRRYAPHRYASHENDNMASVRNVNNIQQFDLKIKILLTSFYIEYIIISHEILVVSLTGIGFFFRSSNNSQCMLHLSINIKTYRCLK
jgi:hypothetical protein